jgi:hypothetical protein
LAQLGGFGVGISEVFSGFSVFQTQLSHRGMSFVEDQTVHVVGEVGERDLGLGPFDADGAADGADEQPHLVFLQGEAGSADIYSQPVGGFDILLYLAFNNRPETIVILAPYPTVEYSREHFPLGKLREKLLQDEITNVQKVILFADDGAWRNELAVCLEMNA